MCHPLYTTNHHVFFVYQLHILSSAISPCGHNFGWISLLHDSQVDKIITQVSNIYDVYYKKYLVLTPTPPKKRLCTLCKLEMLGLLKLSIIYLYTQTHTHIYYTVTICCCLHPLPLITFVLQ